MDCFAAWGRQNVGALLLIRHAHCHRTTDDEDGQLPQQ